MRRSLVFAVLSTPVLAFAGLTLWAQFSASGSALDWTELSLPVRVGLALNNWTIRIVPFVAIGLALAWPLFILAIVAVTGSLSSHNGARPRDVLLWWCVSAAACLALAATVGLSYYFQPDATPPAAFLASLGWMAAVAFWISLSAVYLIQQNRYVAGETTWHPKWLLAGLVALNCVGLYALPILLVVAFRKGTHRARWPANKRMNQTRR
jgi:hypothetical protein